MRSQPASETHLRDVYETESLGAYIRETIRRHEYIRYVAAGELRVRQMNSFLGNVWHLLNPALQIAIFFVIFKLVLSIDRGVDNFILFLTVGMLTFQFVQKVASAGARAIVSNGPLMRTISFPRSVLPLTATWTETLAMLAGPPIIIVVALSTGVTPRLTWLMVIPLTALLVVFGAGASFVAARATSHVGDVEQILPFLFRLLFYVSGVIFSVDAYVDGSYRIFFVANPIYAFVTVHRWAWGAAELPDADVFVSAVAWTVVGFIAGFAWFRRAEGSYGRT